MRACHNQHLAYFTRCVVLTINLASHAAQPSRLAVEKREGDLDGESGEHGEGSANKGSHHDSS